jgi:ABC-type phosphate/phosphonate transport system substrate-binding protein
MRIAISAACAAAVGLGCLTYARAAGDDHRDSVVNSVRIGMVGTLFRDTPEPLVLAMMHPFSALMESQTGIAGQMMPGGDALHLGQMLAEDRVQIGVFHGVEFGWAKQKYPDLRPLMIAVNQQRKLHAFVIVRADDAVNSLADLQGKPLALPKRSREHCRLFLEQRCRHCGAAPDKFFASVTIPATAEDALDDIVEGASKGAVIDGVSLECYKRRKPGRFRQLRILESSETFPAAVVAYRAGAVDEETLRRLRDGLIHANESGLGRQFMALWRLTGFEPVPEDYDEMVASILKAYPQPLTCHSK